MQPLPSYGLGAVRRKEEAVLVMIMVSKMGGPNLVRKLQNFQNVFHGKLLHEPFFWWFLML